MAGIKNMPIFTIIFMVISYRTTFSSFRLTLSVTTGIMNAQNSCLLLPFLNFQHTGGNHLYCTFPFYRFDKLIKIFLPALINDLNIFGSAFHP